MTLPPYGEVYVVTCSINGKQYVGQTTQGAEKRWVTHCGDTKAGRGFLLSRAIRKYGLENFTMRVEATALETKERMHLAHSTPENKEHMRQLGLGKVRYA